MENNIISRFIKIKFITIIKLLIISLMFGNYFGFYNGYNKNETKSTTDDEFYENVDNKNQENNKLAEKDQAISQVAEKVDRINTKDNEFHNEDDKNNNTMLYIIGAFALAVLIFFLGKWIWNKSNNSKNHDVKSNDSKTHNKKKDVSLNKKSSILKTEDSNTNKNFKKNLYKIKDIDKLHEIYFQYNKTEIIINIGLYNNDDNNNELFFYKNNELVSIDNNQVKIDSSTNNDNINIFYKALGFNSVKNLEESMKKFNKELNNSHNKEKIKEWIMKFTNKDNEELHPFPILFNNIELNTNIIYHYYDQNNGELKDQMVYTPKKDSSSDESNSDSNNSSDDESDNDSNN